MRPVFATILIWSFGAAGAPYQVTIDGRSADALNVF
jgi:hypothetical protein